jgi:hypothetical protein
MSVAASANAHQSNTRKNNAFPLLWAICLVAVGVILLLDNFMLLGDFNAVALLPLLLVVAGTQVLLKGDFLPASETRPFVVTRGSVESGTLEISAGDVDVDIYPLQRENRLIAGQYAVGTTPELKTVQDNYSHIIMNRANTPWYAMADWQVGLAKDLPWQFLISTHLGQIDLDLSELIVHEAIVASGMGDIRISLPQEPFKTLFVRSTFGNIQLKSAERSNVRIRVEKGRFFNIKHDADCYQEVAPYVFETIHFDDQAPIVEVVVRGTFGNAYLA